MKIYCAKCNHVFSAEVPADGDSVPCPKCGAPVVKGFGKNRSVFFSCSEYPKCDFSVWDTPTDKKCPTCGGMLLVKKGKNMLYCINKECSYKEELPEDQKTES